MSSISINGNRVSIRDGEDFLVVDGNGVIMSKNGSTISTSNEGSVSVNRGGVYISSREDYFTCGFCNRASRRIYCCRYSYSTLEIDFKI